MSLYAQRDGVRVIKNEWPIQTGHSFAYTWAFRLLLLFCSSLLASLLCKIVHDWSCNEH